MNPAIFSVFIAHNCPGASHGGPGYDVKLHPTVPPGWGLGVRLTTSPWNNKNLLQKRREEEEAILVNHGEEEKAHPWMYL